MEDMGRDPGRERATCGHVPLGQPETTNQAAASDQYAAKHDPFVYFHSIIDDAARCDAHVVNLERLPRDLAGIATTANYIFITPNLCNDGHDAQCVDGRRGGLAAIELFLSKWVPLIERGERTGVVALTLPCVDEGVLADCQRLGVFAGLLVRSFSRATDLMHLRRRRK